MKKFVLILFTMAMVASCGTTKIERQAQRTFKGDWVLTHVQLPSALVDVSLFDDADSRCFQNSEWHFVSNNNKGNYQLLQENCTPGERGFYWNVVENLDNGEFYFTLKPETKGSAARAQKSGYKLKLISLNETNMVWEQTVSYQGEPFTIVMNFSKK